MNDRQRARLARMTLHGMDVRRKREERTLRRMIATTILAIALLPVLAFSCGGGSYGYGEPEVEGSYDADGNFTPYVPEGTPPSTIGGGGATR